MPAIKPSCVRDLKLRVNLADVVSRVVTLRKAGGARLKGLCPFHNEKTPSFNVDTDKGFFKCFGCGKAGDAISFVRETEQLNFTEAVEALGQRFNIPIEYEAGSGGPSREERSLRQEIYDLHEHAAEHFHQAFKAQDATGEFMRKLWHEQRKFPLELADEFKIGAADATGSGLGAALLRKKFSESALRQCGLFFIYDDALLTGAALRPRFRGRLMIPIRDHQGRVVAFTARQTELTPPDDPAHEAKYVNSPETPIFTKSNLLFNLDRARSHVGDGHPFVIVEGQLDALRCWSVGLKTAIAPQGTSITEGQLVLLRRYHTQVECFFDSDSAGQKAALRFLPMALKAGLEVRFLTLAGASKLDPDLLFLERGLPAYEEVRRGAQSAMAFACRATLPDPDKATAEQKSAATKTIRDLISNGDSQVIRMLHITEASRFLRVHISAIIGDSKTWDGVAVGANPGPNRQKKEAIPSSSNFDPSSALLNTEATLLMLTLNHEQLGRALAAAIPHDWIDTGHIAGALLNRVLAEFEQNSWPGREHLEALLETPEERTLVATLIFNALELDDPAKVAAAGLQQLRARALEPRLRQIELALANPQPDSDFDPISLLKERSELQRQLRQPITLNLVG